MSTAALLAIAVVTLAGALAAALFTRLIHAALSLVLAFVGTAAFLLLLGAEFVGLVRLLVSVGGVAVLIVFTILLTQSDEKRRQIDLGGIVISAAIFAGLVWAIASTPSTMRTPGTAPLLTVQIIGEALMKDYVWPLECVGVILTAALIGALVLAMEEKR